jgi:Uma2 family endonuclease
MPIEQEAAMNVAVTRGAEGFPRRAFSVDDIRRMIDIGLIAEDERFELIEGDIVVMASKSIAHDHMQNALNLALVRAVPDGLYVGNGSTIQLAEDILVEPDLAIIAKSVYKAEPRSFAQPQGKDVLLLIEIAVSSLAYDRKVKAQLYAKHGIREYWLIDALERTAWVHTGPAGEGWSSIVERGPQDLLTTDALPGFSVRLGEID